MWILLTILYLIQAHATNGARISESEFNAAVTSCGSPTPSPDIYPHFADGTKDFSREELAEFIAQLIHESGGFRYREEQACLTGDRCAGSYIDNVGLPGKSYHGRGFIQLTWGANYKAASEALGLGDQLLREPELVSNNVKIAVDVSTWYWRDRVRPQVASKKGQFGATTRAINGAIECSGGFNQRASNRYQCYLKVADALKITNKDAENGCYN
ncbi:hypothetical protein QAD02_020008 [Eretmocerus hayati]|uniref:Uncharacterized protein n=1 Tax=Eretmocerus hayati TaxID=131215 RepID=A0ACC2PL60_9HYME|nr:hypothetical protein QAD02_020008 [Eretmocerus hayati]